jgi:hypothetical protein
MALQNWVIQKTHKAAAKGHTIRESLQGLHKAADHFAQKKAKPRCLEIILGAGFG